MGVTHLSGLEVAGVPTMGMSGIPATDGNVYFVNSVRGSDGNEGTADSPLATLAAAYTKCTADHGDIVVLTEGHAETISAAGGVTLNKSGVIVWGLGVGSKLPAFTFGTSTAATMVISGANQWIRNIVGICNINALVSPFVIQAADVRLDAEWRDGANNKEALRAVLTTAAADRLTLNLKYLGYTDGSAVVNAIRLVGANTADISVDFYGVVTTAVVEFHTTACSNVNVEGNFYVSGITNLSRNVVDTVTGSTWTVQGFDGAAGSTFSGGSGAAVAADDVSTVNSKIGTITNTGGTATIGAVLGDFANTTLIGKLNVPTADATANVSVTEVAGNKTDAAVTTVGTTKSIIAYAKGILTWIGTITNTGGTATIGAVIGDFANTTLVGKLNVPTADATANVSVTEVVGNKTDAAVYVPGTTKSLAAYAKGIANLQENVAAKSAAVMANGDTLFTVAGGPIAIEALWSECVTANDATASTVQYQSVPTSGSAQTISAASASIANAAAGASISLIGTALTTAALYNANGPNLGMSPPGGIIAPAGTIKIVVAVGSTTGTWRHYIRYRPLAVGVTVS